ncbi:MAG TPA: alkaline phosphatase family protein [Candidatus Eisenbacteria bacterium]|nr:alkaline phosphatase family protein [Candidatus Eisenbacteria bacterium]
MTGARRSVRALSVAALLLLTGCGVRGPTGVSPSPSPATAPVPAQTPPARLPAGAAVFAIVMENRSSTQALAQPYLAALAGRYALATNYHAVAHPSLPNYLALTSGSTYGIADDDYHALAAGGIGQQLTEREIPWRAYMEGLPADCRESSGRYAVNHDPFAYYGGGCPPNVVGLASLDADLAGDTSRFVWITPDLCHDGHDCSARTADDFLAGLVPRILASPAWMRGGVLFVTWDEDDGSTGNQVSTVVVAPRLLAHRSARPYDHYSLLATIEDLLGVPRLGAAARAQAMDDLV